MGILNVTPDSFSDGGKFLSHEQAIKHAIKMEKEGANIIDIGGESTRPGAAPVNAEEELKRVIPVIEELQKYISIPVSIDTSKSQVAKKALDAGADMVNDVTALRGDPYLVTTVKEYDVPLCLMHMNETPQTMQHNPTYDNVLDEIKSFLKKRIQYALNNGISQDQIIIDPGIGFGKRTGKNCEDNCEILARLSEIKSLGSPILVGASRKTFIGNICGKDSPLPPTDRLEGSLVAASIAVMHGADILRVHDVKETKQAISITRCVMNYL
jgi:dihydropteroate synthase